MSEIKLSIIIPVLNSHEAVDKQMYYLVRLFEIFEPAEMPFEAIIVDDGSDPPIRIKMKCLALRVIRTHDFRPWTQPRARNIGAMCSVGEMLAFVDIDHIVDDDLISEVYDFRGDRMDWRRIPARIGDIGNLKPAPGEERKPAAGIFAMRAEIYRKLGGFDERFCGEYGFDDLDFLERFNKLVEAGEAKPSVTAKAPGYYWTGEDAPAFHDLSHEPSTRNVQILSEKANEPVS